MHTVRLIVASGCVALVLLGAGGRPAGAQRSAGPPAPASPDWRRLLAEKLPAYGHRNWIVIADAAYPAQTSPGIETVVTGAGPLEVLRTVLERLGAARHVRPVVYLDAELPHVPEADAPGIVEYRKGLVEALAGRPTHSLPHEQIIARLDEAGRTFKVLILKTDLTLPYTSVFLELDCGYWSPEAETRLREAMRAHSK